MEFNAIEITRNNNDTTTETPSIEPINRILEKIRKLPANDNLKNYPRHPFVPYSGKRLETLVKSIKENGIIFPIIVRPAYDENYEILSGHNRVNAAKEAGFTEIPVIIREDLKDDDDKADMFVNETNVQQRTFETWLHSERIKSIFMFHEAIKNQGQRSDLKSETFGEVSQKSDYARNKTADAYGVSEHIIRLYLELYNLIDALKNRLDLKEFGTTPASNLSFIPSEIQKLVDDVLNENGDKKIYKITIENSVELKNCFKDYAVKDLNDENKESVKNEIRQILKKDNGFDVALADNNFEIIKMPKNSYNKLFQNKTNEEIVNEIVEAVTYCQNIKEEPPENLIVQPIYKSS